MGQPWQGGGGGYQPHRPPVNPRYEETYRPPVNPRPHTRVMPEPGYPPRGGRPDGPGNYRPDGPPPGGGGAPPAPPRRRRRWRVRRILAIVLVLLVVGAVAMWFYMDSSLNRVTALTDYSGRPAQGAGTNWLIVGSDSRQGLTDAQAAQLHTGDSGAVSGGRTDTIMLVHLPDNSTKPTMVSLLRDSWVEIPGHGHNKINAAYAFGGPTLLVKTVEQATGLRIDHYAEIGLGGFAGVVDDVGGVQMCLPQAVKDSYAGINLPAGCQTLNGANALGYVRSRHAFATSDYARTQHQREFLGALANKIASPGVLLNPFDLFPVLFDLPGALTVDNGDHLQNLISLGWNMRGISDGGLVTTAVPINGTTHGSLLWDKTKATQLFHDLNTDQAVPSSLITNH
ncbi:MAG TPA: LCP family protein [Pseudonocardiaceae bacterium]|nr:LCP family protein [Pseudonocardiaceae bacterium]